jgi:hypothetical protein
MEMQKNKTIVFRIFGGLAGIPPFGARIRNDLQNLATSTRLQNTAKWKFPYHLNKQPLGLQRLLMHVPFVVRWDFRLDNAHVHIRCGISSVRRETMFFCPFHLAAGTVPSRCCFKFQQHGWWAQDTDIQTVWESWLMSGRQNATEQKKKLQERGVVAVVQKRHR